jgi:hypothetical protein
MGKAAVPAVALTNIIQLGDPPAPPVFVDSTGVRRARLRRLAYAAGILLAAGLLALWFSQLGAPVRPPSTVPCTTNSAVAPADRQSPARLQSPASGVGTAGKVCA